MRGLRGRARSGYASYRGGSFTGEPCGVEEERFGDRDGEYTCAMHGPDAGMGALLSSLMLGFSVLFLMIPVLRCASQAVDGGLVQRRPGNHSPGKRAPGGGTPPPSAPIMPLLNNKAKGQGSLFTMHVHRQCSCRTGHSLLHACA